MALYTASDHGKPAAAPLTTSMYALFVVRTGEYDLHVRRGALSAWHPRIDVPAGRTRLWIVPYGPRVRGLAGSRFGFVVRNRANPRTCEHANHATSYDPSAADQPEHDDNQRDDEQDVNQAAGHLEGKAERPQHEQNDDQRPQHVELPPAAAAVAL